MFLGLFFFVMLAVGWIAQFVDGTLGMGYGAFSASLLITIGIYPAIASASIHTAECFTTFISGASHFKFGNIKKEWLLPLAVPGVIGGIIGAWLLSSVPGKQIKPFVAIFLLLMGVAVLCRFIPRKKREYTWARAFYRFITRTPPSATQRPKPPLPKSRLKLPILGFIAAAMDAIGGGGWGPIATPGLILTEKETAPRKVVGSVNLAEFFVTVAITATFLVLLGPELFRWDIVMAMLIGGAIAAPIAAFLCKKMPQRLLGILIGVALIGFNIRTLIIAIPKWF